MLITGEMEVKRAQMLLEGTSVVGMMDAQTMTIDKERTGIVGSYGMLRTDVSVQFSSEFVSNIL